MYIKTAMQKINYDNLFQHQKKKSQCENFYFSHLTVAIQFAETMHKTFQCEREKKI